MTNTNDTKQVKRFEDAEARAWSHSYHRVECEVQVDFADCKFFNIKGLTKTFNMEGTMQVKLCVYRTKDFSRKYGKRVKALGGTFTHCRGHNYDRWVTVPFRSVDGWRHCLNAKQLIIDMFADADLHREGHSHELYILAPFVCDQGFRNMVQVRRWSWACKNPFGFAHDALADSVRVIQSLNDTGKACFAQGTGSVSLFEVAEDGSLYDQEWLEMTPVALPAPAEATETPAEATEAPAEELLTIEFTAWATEYVAGYVSQTGLQWVEHNNTVNDENGEQRAWVRNGYTGTTEQFSMLAWYLTQERQRCNLDPSYKRSLTMTLKKLPAPVDPATVNTPTPAEAPAEATEAPVTRISFNDRAFSEIMPLVKEHNLPLTDVCVQSGVLGSDRQQVNLFFEGPEEAFAHLAFFLTQLLQNAESAGLLPCEEEVVACALQSLPAPVDPYAAERVAEATETPAEATEDTNTTPDMPSAEELDSDAFKAFAAEMKALLADVPDALPADMSDAHTLLCVQFAVDKRQHKPCKQYEWGSEFAQCGAELTIQQGIMQFTVPLQTLRQRELFKTLHECSILDDPEMEGARQYLFTQVVLPLARWGCTSEPQVNTALIECMYYEGAGAIMKAGYLACTSKLQ